MKEFKIKFSSVFNFLNSELIKITALYSVLIFIFLGKSFFNEYLAGDWVRFWIPNYYFVFTQLKEGSLPLWQPYAYMGVPGALHPGYMIFYPPLWIVFIFNLLFNSSQSINILGKTLELYLYAHLLLGGVGMFLLLRRLLKLSFLASFSGGFIYIFSFYSMSSFDPTLIGKMYLPLIFFLLLNFLQTGKNISFLLWIGVNIILFTFGYIYYQIYFFYAQLFLAVLFGVRPFLKSLFGLIIAGTISSFILLPQLFYYLQAGRIGESVNENFHIGSSIFPTIFINILTPGNIGYESFLTWGTAMLIFLIAGLVQFKNNKIYIWALIVFFITFIFAIGGHIGIQNILGLPPFFLDKLRSHAQILILTFFSGTIILSYGIDQALKGDYSKTAIKICLGICGILTTVIILIPYLSLELNQSNTDSLILLGKALLLLTTGTALYYFLAKTKLTIFLIGLLLISFLEFHYLYMHREPNFLQSSYSKYFTRNSLIPEIPSENSLFRYEFWQNQFAYNASPLKVFSLAGYDGIPYQAFYSLSRFPAPLNYQFANVKYVVSGTEKNVEGLKFIGKINPKNLPDETIFSEEKGFASFTPSSDKVQNIYEVKNYLPRFFAPVRVKTCTDKDCYKSENPPVLIYSTANFGEMENPDSKKVKIKTISYTPNKITLDINTPEKTFIASSEVYDKGWKLKVNNIDSTIYNTSSGFRGFIVPGGKNQAVMTYFPPLLKEGIVISILGLIVLIGATYKFKKKK